MIKSTTWYEGDSKFETYKIQMRGEVKILVKKNGKAHQVIRFAKVSGVIKQPTDN